MEVRRDSQSFYPRRRRRRRLEGDARQKSDNLGENHPLASRNNGRFKFLLYSCLMNNMICLVLLITLAFPFLTVQGQEPHPSPAGFLDFDNLPVTRFTCDGKVIGGYYADVETGCQMFHVCTLGQKDEIQDIKFLCVNGTVFDQETRVCERVDEVDCSQAEKFYDLNLDLYVPYVVTTTKGPEEATTPSTTTTTTTTTTTPRPTPSAMIFSQFRPIHTYLSSQRFHHHSLKPPANHSSGKGSSSFSYYQRNPQSNHHGQGLRDQKQSSSPLTSSEFNSNFRQSYIINHNQNDESDRDSNPTGRKVPGGGAKTIFYNPHQSFQRNYSKSPSYTMSTTTTTTTTTTPQPPSTEEPEYYDEDYSETAAEDSSAEDVNYHMEHRQSKKLLPHQEEENPSSEKSEEVDKRQSNNSTLEKQEPVYYDEYGEEAPVEYSDEDHAIINPNEHHFTHVDVPRIPYAKPNVPRVLVTNGKPFLPRLRRQSLHYHRVHLIPYVYKHPTDSSATHILLY